VRGHQGFQADESRILSKDILDNPEDFSMAIERYSCSVVSIIGWGRRISRKDDPIVERALEFMHTAAQIFVPGDYWMETLPLLQYLPSWLYTLPSNLKMASDAMNKYWYALSKEGSTMSKEMCFSKYVLGFEKEELRPEEIAGLTGNLIGGGVDTTTSTMLSFILAAVAFPEAMKPAKEEIDRVVGNSRSPDFGDEGELVYTRALIKEVLRWRSVAILGGLPHAPTRDDTYRGYLIPANTSIMVFCSWMGLTSRRIFGLFTDIRGNFLSRMYSNLNGIWRKIDCHTRMKGVTILLGLADDNVVDNRSPNKVCSHQLQGCFGPLTLNQL
jgi:hypothetical protein